jgi:hypothetical protein
MGSRIETIVEIGAAGGSLTLQGRRDAGGHWQFRTVTDEADLYVMLGEEPTVPTTLPWVSLWDEALALLDRYPWPKLHPIAVHSEFKETVLAAVAAHSEGGSQTAERWRNRLEA